MHAIARYSRFIRHALLASCLLTGGAASAFAQLPEPVCEYTGPEVVGVDEPFMLCGPEAEGYSGKAPASRARPRSASP